MATNNFHNENANKIFAVLMNYERPILDDDGNETDETEYVSPDEFEYEMLTEGIAEELASIESLSYYESGDASFLRSYEGTSLGTLKLSKDYLDVECSVSIIPVIKSGYYEGANLDWEMRFEADGYDTDTIEDFIEEWEYNADHDNNPGLVAMNKKYVKNWAETTLDFIVEEVEKVFENFTEIKLRKVGGFSNGEAIYEKSA